MTNLYLVFPVGGFLAFSSIRYTFSFPLRSSGLAALKINLWCCKVKVWGHTPNERSTVCFKIVSGFNSIFLMSIPTPLARVKLCPNRKCLAIKHDQALFGYQTYCHLDPLFDHFDKILTTTNIVKVHFVCLDSDAWDCLDTQYHINMLGHHTMLMFDQGLN